MKEPKLYGTIALICLSILLTVFLLSLSVDKMMLDPSMVLGMITAYLIALISFLVSTLVYSLKSLKSKESISKQEVDMYPLFHHMHEEHNLILTESELAEIIHIVQYIQKEGK